MTNSLIDAMAENPVVILKAKNVWLSAYEVAFNFKTNTYSGKAGEGVIPELARDQFFKVITAIDTIPEPQEPLRKVKIDCNYELSLFGCSLTYTNYHFQINPQLTNFQRALLKLAESCGLKVY